MMSAGLVAGARPVRHAGNRAAKTQIDDGTWSGLRRKHAIEGGTAHGSLVSLFEMPDDRSLDFIVQKLYIPRTLSKRIVSTSMTQALREKAKLLNRVRRVRGLLDAIERALDEEKGCPEVLHLIAAARGGINGLMGEVIEDHIREHVVEPTKPSERFEGGEELIQAIQSYLK